jgi:Cdc6-like AAA superfamily ATPase
VSLQLLESLEDARAFEATHRFEHLSDFHIPFDDLTASETTESVLRLSAERQDKVALVGPSGAGKSSVIASVLGPLAEGLAEEVVPLRIPVAALDAETAKDPTAFAQHLLRTVIRYSTEILTPEERAALSRSAADQVSREGGGRNRRFSVGAPKLLLDLGFASEVKSEAEQFVEEGAGSALEGATRLVELFHAHNRQPFLIVDDSDHWIRVAGKDLTETADGFFLHVVPFLAREIGCGFVLAIHDQYLDLQSYREAGVLLSRIIQLPRPAEARSRSAMAAILERRIEVAGLSASWSDALDASAIGLLAEIYERNGSLRKMLATVDRATQLGCTNRVETVTVELIQAALVDLG